MICTSHAFGGGPEQQSMQLKVLRELGTTAGGVGWAVWGAQGQASSGERTGKLGDSCGRQLLQLCVAQHAPRHQFPALLALLSTTMLWCCRPAGRAADGPVCTR